MKLRPIGKKGNVSAVTNSLVTGVIGLLVVVGVLVGLKAFQDTQVTGVAGCNTTVTRGCGAAYNLTGFTGQLANKFGQQLPTVGTMFGVALILGAIGLLGYGIAYGANRMK